MTIYFLRSDYVYETEVGEAEDVPIIIIHFGTVFAGTETSAVSYRVSSIQYLCGACKWRFLRGNGSYLSSNEIKMKMRTI